MAPITRVGLAVAFALAATVLCVLSMLLATCWGIFPAVVVSITSGFGLVQLFPEV